MKVRHLLEALLAGDILVYQNTSLALTSEGELLLSGPSGNTIICSFCGSDRWEIKEKRPVPITNIEELAALGIAYLSNTSLLELYNKIDYLAFSPLQVDFWLRSKLLYPTKEEAIRCSKAILKSLP